MKEGFKRRQTIELKMTEDGSHTLFVPGLKEHYHSVFGAVSESRHIFLEAGFKHVSKSCERIRLLEIGFGTGLNTLLTYLESNISGFETEYTAVEINPLSEDIYQNLNYPECISYPNANEYFQQIHRSPWNIWSQFSEDFALLKLNTSLFSYQPEKEAFDLIYFDAFGPDVQPEMWTKEVFEKMAHGLKKQGVLVTYSTKGTVKRNLSGAGFSLEKLPGPKGKREILRATKM